LNCLAIAADDNTKAPAWGRVKNEKRCSARPSDAFAVAGQSSATGGSKEGRARLSSRAGVKYLLPATWSELWALSPPLPGYLVPGPCCGKEVPAAMGGTRLNPRYPNHPASPNALRETQTATVLHLDEVPARAWFQRHHPILPLYRCFDRKRPLPPAPAMYFGSLVPFPSLAARPTALQDCSRRFLGWFF